MRKSDSDNSLEENLVTNSQTLTTIPTSTNKNKKDQEKILTATKLRKSFSEDIPFIESENEKLVTSAPQLPTLSTNSPIKIKSRSRLSAAFRSLRRTKSISKKNSKITIQSKRDSFKTVEPSTLSQLEINPSESFLNSSINQTTEPPSEVKNKKSKLSKRFSLSGIKKHKSSSHKSKTQIEKPTLVSSGTQTPSNLLLVEPHILRAGNFSNSQLSLIATNTGVNIEKGKLEKVQKNQSSKTTTKSGKNRKQRKSTPIKTTSFTEDEDYLTALPEDSSVLENKNTKEGNLGDKNQEITNTSGVDERRDERGKLNVTESTRDTPPQERAPAKPILDPNLTDYSSDLTDISPIKVKDTTAAVITTTTTTTPTSATGNPILSDNNGNKGAIRKSVNYQQTHAKLKRQQSRDEYFDSDRFLQREGNLDRGRRIPRRSLATFDQSSLPESQQKQQPQSQPSNAIHIEQQQEYISTKDKTIIQSGNNITNPNLSGSIVNTTNQSFEESEEQHPLSVRETKIQFSVGKAVRPNTSILSQIPSSDTKDYSSIGSNKSSDSASPVSESSSVARRKIKYIDQATFYTDEEQAILAGKREIYANFSRDCEYSRDSTEFSFKTQMPAFGDLTMDHEEAPIMTSSSAEKREHLYKILVIGELGTGKTSFIKRYVHQFFSHNYRATIGVDFALKVLHWDKNTIVRLQLWDIAGQERFGNMTRVYYKEAVGAFIVFDVTRSGTFDCVSKWKEDLDSKVQLPDGSPIPCILLANKCDQEKQCAITPEKMEEYCRENGFAGWFETSAKDNINIEEAARALVNKILLNDKLISASDITDNDKFALGGGNGSSTSQVKKSCSC